MTGNSVPRCGRLMANGRTCGRPPHASGNCVSAESIARKKASSAGSQLAQNARRKEERRLAREARQSQRAGHSPYDKDDYVLEFGELTDLGMSCREIVERSAPSLTWFRVNVFPVAPKALCITCKGYFSPAILERGTECSPECRNSYTGFGSWGRKKPLCCPSGTP